VRLSPIVSRVRILTLLAVGVTTVSLAPRTIAAGVPASPPAVSPTSAVQAAGVAQRACSLSWTGKEAEIEEYLRTAPVTKMEDVPIGVTKPRRAVFAPGGPAARASWKVLPPAFRNGFHESYKAELAAYALDQVLDLNRVPPVVERKIDRQVGAMTLWIENIKGWDAKNPPSGPEPAWSHEISRMKLFDLLIANIDRNQGNLLYDADWHIFLIDHSRAFTDRKNLKGIAPVVRVDRELWDRMAALTMEQMKPTVGAWLSEKELAAILIRRDLMRGEIAKLVAKSGEANVFF
jgi:hypothetical protein